MLKASYCFEVLLLNLAFGIIMIPGNWSGEYRFKSNLPGLVACVVFGMFVLRFS